MGKSTIPPKDFVGSQPAPNASCGVPRTQLIIFVKAPRAGFVKTRLAATIGSETALETYETLVEIITTQLRSIENVDLHFVPADARDEVSGWLQEGWTASPQADGDLGEKLKTAFQQAFDRGFERVIIIGSDCPYVESSDIDEAEAQLEQHDVVLGPATDGGYWLIGLSNPAPTLFENINWSTETVFAETLAHAEQARLVVARIRELSDVDTVTDLMRFHEWKLTQPSRA
ncbi:MAG: TIGR04282 family arsenosugar biosynthesis glycosyltransferase [Limisphaerales bacterium]